MTFLDPFLSHGTSGGPGLLEPPPSGKGAGADLDLGGAGPPPIDWDRFGGWGGGGGAGDDEGLGGEGERPGLPKGAAELGLSLGLISISALFAIFFAAHLWLRRSAEVWPPPGMERVPVGLWTSSVLLVLCSVGLETAARHVRHETSRRRTITKLLALALVLGLAFLAAQIHVWRLLVLGGHLPNESGFLSVFYALTGLHALHVLGGMLYLALLLYAWARVTALIPDPDAIRRCAIYWHFMAALWALLFLLLYLPKSA